MQDYCSGTSNAALPQCCIGGSSGTEERTIEDAKRGFQQRLPDTSIEPKLFVDGPSVCLKLLLMLVLRGIEQLADDPVVQAD